MVRPVPGTIPVETANLEKWQAFLCDLYLLVGKAQRSLLSVPAESLKAPREGVTVAKVSKLDPR
jgi:hypothetical protein